MTDGVKFDLSGGFKGESGEVEEVDLDSREPLEQFKREILESSSSFSVLGE